MTGALAALLLQAAAAAVSYEVTCGPRCAELQVEAALPPAAGARLAIDEGIGPFVRGAQFQDGGRWVDAVVRGDEVLAAGCRQGSCRVRYRLLLADAARQLKERGPAIAQDGIVAARPSSFLLRPARPAGGERFRLRVTTPGGTRFATGLFAGAQAGTYEGALADLAAGPHSVFGAFTAGSVTAGGGSIEVAIAPALAGHRREILAWVSAAAKDVASFYGRYPVPRGLVLVLAGRKGVSYGSTVGNGGASILIWVAPASVSTLGKDPVLVHEMVHFGIPGVPRKDRWLEEGLATYVGPIARAGAGRLPSKEVWAGLLDGLPRAIPGATGIGLDSRSWASTYWGGALFAFLADVSIRERTGNRKSLRDALRGVQAAGGSIAVRWPVERTLAAGDQATGTTVLREIHDRLTRRIDVDLRDMWRRLGVSRENGVVAFDDRAPLARVRRGITEGATGRR